MGEKTGFTQRRRERSPDWKAPLPELIWQAGRTSEDEKEKLKCRVKEKKLNHGIARLPAGLLGGKNHEKNIRHEFPPDKQRSPDWKAPRTSEGEQKALIHTKRKNK